MYSSRKVACGATLSLSTVGSYSRFSLLVGVYLKSEKSLDISPFHESARCGSGDSCRQSDLCRVSLICVDVVCILRYVSSMKLRPSLDVREVCSMGSRFTSGCTYWYISLSRIGRSAEMAWPSSGSPLIQQIS